MKLTGKFEYQHQLTEKPEKSVTVTDIHGSFKEATDKFKNEQTKNPGVIHWMSTYDIAIVSADVLFPLFNKALPNKVKANDKYYEHYDKLWKWIDKNCVGLVTHSNIQFWFEDEREALMFKMTWG